MFDQQAWVICQLIKREYYWGKKLAYWTEKKFYENRLRLECFTLLDFYLQLLHYKITGHFFEWIESFVPYDEKYVYFVDGRGISREKSVNITAMIPSIVVFLFIVIIQAKFKSIPKETNRLLQCL